MTADIQLPILGEDYRPQPATVWHDQTLGISRAIEKMPAPSVEGD